MGEVSRMTGVKPYILRYWESHLTALRPARRRSGHRRFSKKDVETIDRLRELIYERRYTLEGAKKHLREEGKRGPVQISLGFEESTAALQTLKEVKKAVADMLQTMRARG